MDEIIREKINKITGYRKPKLCVTTKELFKKLGMDINSRLEYSQLMQIIHNDRKAFCEDAWKTLEKRLVYREDFKDAYEEALRYWYKQGRTLLYPREATVKDGTKVNIWYTPKTLDEFQKLEDPIAMSLAKGIINKQENLSKVRIQLPYSKEVKTLKENIMELENKKNIWEEKK